VTAGCDARRVTRHVGKLHRETRESGAGPAGFRRPSGEFREEGGNNFLRASGMPFELLADSYQSEVMLKVQDRAESASLLSK
jgi:hypothetical protein